MDRHHMCLSFIIVIPAPSILVDTQEILAEWKTEWLLPTVSFGIKFIHFQASHHWLLFYSDFWVWQGLFYGKRWKGVVEILIYQEILVYGYMGHFIWVGKLHRREDIWSEPWKIMLAMLSRNTGKISDFVDYFFLEERNTF